MRILVCGGRDYDNKPQLKNFIKMFVKNYAGKVTIIHGSAKGADTLAGEIAKEMGFIVEAYPADWEKYGKAAGPIRNSFMLKMGEPDIIIAVKGGKGTENMVKQAKKKNKTVYQYDEYGFRI